MRSWRKVIFRLTAVALSSITVFALIANLLSYQQIRRTYRNENQQVIQSWSKSVEIRLNSVREHLYDMVLIVYNHGIELQSGTERMPYMDQYAIHDELTEKLMISSDASYFYVRDTESDLLLCANASSAVRNNVAVRSWLMENKMESGKLNDQLWQIVRIGDSAYFARSVSFGKYVIGAMCLLDNFAITEDIHVFGEEISCLLHYGEELYAVGHSDLEDPVQILPSGEIRPNHREIMTSSCSFHVVDAEGILAVRQNSMRETVISSAAILAGSGVACIALLILLIVYTQRLITKPAEKMLKAMEQIQNGNLDYRITSLNGSLEFDMLAEGMNNMVEQIQHLRIEAYDRIVQKQTEELTRMRAQLRPHFYLNAITTVSNMTYNDQNEEIRTYLAALARFMRYMLQQKESQTTVAQELENVRNYLQLQKIRFPGKVDAFVGCVPDAEEIEIPYLILFTAVENVFKHAINPYRKLQLIIQCETVRRENFAGCRITVEDNGEGFSQEVLDTFRQNMEMPQPKDHLGLTNISRTLQLVYGRKDLLVLSNSPARGARVELWIPDADAGRSGEEK